MAAHGFRIRHDARLLPAQLKGSGTFEPTVSYIYLKQLEEAQIIVISKIDQTDDQTALRHLMTERYPGKTILYQDSFDNDHISRWLQTLDETAAETAGLPSLDIDYDRYGEGEAKLAWLDQQLEFQSSSHRAQDAALALIRVLGNIDLTIAHLKFLLDGQTKLSFTSNASTDSFLPTPADTATLLINARIRPLHRPSPNSRDEAITTQNKMNTASARSPAAARLSPPYTPHRLSSFAPQRPHRIGHRGPHCLITHRH